MALMEVDLKNGHSRETRTAHKTEKNDTIKPSRQPEVVVVATVTDYNSSVPPGVRPSIAASLEKSLKQHAPLWKALANH